jgi:hypothetical protein
MTEAEIQAIVGFIRQWESTAPEVAVPARGGGGGPPWMRNNTTTTTNSTTQQSTGQGTQSGTGQGQGKGQGQGTGTPWWQAFDWRILLLIFGALSISFTLIFMGFESLRNFPKKK